MPTRRSILMGPGLAAAIILGPVFTVRAQAAALAIDGYDPVAYFTHKRPVKGTADIHQDFDGKRYLFASTKHREMFAANPERYEPQFNGLCAGNVSVGHKVKADPLIWRVLDNKLYVFAKPQADEQAVAAKVAKAHGKWVELK